MSRYEMKARAKAQLGNGIFQNNWMLALLVCLLTDTAIALAGGLVAGFGAFIIMGAFLYAKKKMFLKQTRDGQAMDIEDVIVGFKENFGRNFLLGLMQGIFILLWSLLFFIPGIVKAYSYSMSFYIASEHQELDWREVITASRKMMVGNKWRLFILDLSFIGWYIVGALCLGIGTLWVAAYHEAARAQFYQSICRNYVDPRSAEEMNGASYEYKYETTDNGYKGAEDATKKEQSQYEQSKTNNYEYKQSEPYRSEAKQSERNNYETQKTKPNREYTDNSEYGFTLDDDK